MIYALLLIVLRYTADDPSWTCHCHHACLITWDKYHHNNNNNDNNNNTTGHIGFWNADEGNDVVGGKAQVGGEDGVYLYRPHAQSISSLYIPPHTPEQVWSTSYDGTVRRMDLEREAFVEVYRASGEFEDVSFHDAAFSGSGVAYLGCRTGEVMALDGRSGEVSWSAQAHDGEGEGERAREI